MLKFVAVAVLFVVAVNGANLLGANECTYGPSYWCDSFQNAAKCSAMDHCAKVWKQLPVTQVSPSVVCDFCQDIITDLKNFVTAGATKSTIQGYMNRACEFLPDAFSRTTCKEVADHYLDELISMADMSLDPSTSCALLGLCGSKKDLNQIPAVSAVVEPLKTSFARVSLSAAKVPVKAEESPFCSDCKTLIATIKSEIDDKSNQAAMTNALEGECAQIGGDLAAECKTLVDMFVPQMVGLIDEELTNDLCVMVGLCKNASVTITMKTVVDKARAVFVQKLRSAGKLNQHIRGVASRVSADDTCTTCEEVLNTAKLFLNNNSTEQQIESVLEDDVCTQLGSFSAMCKEIIEQYMPKLWKQFMDGFDPKTLCGDLGLCNTTVTIEAPQLSVVKPIQLKPKATSGPGCALCEFAIEKLESMLSTNATEEEIEKALDKVCDLLPSTVSKECENLVQQYGPAIIKLLVNDAAPATLCTFLGLCSGTGVQEVTPVANLKGEDCIMCTMALTYAKTMLTKNDTVQEIEKALLGSCSSLPQLFVSKCTTMVKQYGPAILKAVAGEISPKDICKEVGLCTASMKADGLVHLYNKSNI